MKVSQVVTIGIIVIIAAIAGYMFGSNSTPPIIPDEKDGAVIVLKPRKDASGGPSDHPYLVWEETLSGVEYTEGGSMLVDCCVDGKPSCELRADFIEGATSFQLFKDTTAGDVSEKHEAGIAELTYEADDGSVAIFHIEHRKDETGLFWEVSIDGAPFCELLPKPEDSTEFPWNSSSSKRQHCGYSSI